MARSRLLGLGVAVALLAGVAVATALDPRAGWPEFVFGSVVCLSAQAAVLLAGRAGRRFLTERERARRLSATSAEDVARHAVSGERARLAADIERVVRTAAREMGRAARDADREWDGDPVPALRAVQDHGHRAGIELRRLLGLLRDVDEEPTDGGGGRPPQPCITRSDVLVASAVTALAVAELFVWAAVEGVDSARPLVVVLTACAAATVVFRRARPGWGAAACGLVFAIGIGSQPVGSGLWVIATLGGLTWTAVGRRTAGDTAGAAVLAVGVLGEFALRDAENLPITALLLTCAAAGGLISGWSDARGRLARDRAEARSAELAAVARDSAHRVRLAVARELHDLVSHGVGVMVVQAEAAIALRRSDPARARRAVEVVRRTASDTLAGLDRLIAIIQDGAFGAPLAGPVPPEGADLAALAERMRAAGLTLRLECPDAPDGETAGAVYRIVQESLTNALRHAPGARVLVRIERAATGTEVEILDDGPGPGAGTRRGYGLVGIAERVHTLGGELSAGPRSETGGFRVHALLPTARAGAP